MTAPFRAVVFDFDYTLADSSRGAVECINFALANLGLPLASNTAIQRTIGLSLVDTLQELAGPEQAVRSDEFVRLFKIRADEVMAELTFVYDTVQPTITRLQQAGLSLGIVSTKFRRRIEQILKREQLLAGFEVIIGGEDVLNHKPNPEGLQKAVERLAVSNAQALYVGDSITDAETARRAQIPFVAVLSGVTPKEAFADYPVYGIVPDLTQLTTLYA